MKVTADLVSSKQSDNLCIKSTNKSSLQGTSNNCTRDIGPNSSKVPTSNHTENQKNKPKPLEPVTKINHEKQNLTFITGSCILKNIETRCLDENVRIKSFRKAKIENLKDSLTQMDLSRYKNIILHIGGHDVDSGISQTSFREKYLNLLECMKQENCKTYVSGLLPRGGTNMKPFNEILKELCKQSNAIYIDNHDSFIMASGELPFDLYHADKVNLKFSGIRTLVHNIHDNCAILPKKTKHHHSVHIAGTQNWSSRLDQQGSRYSPIYIH